MSVIDVFWHVLNFFAPAFGVGLLGAAAAKWLWRAELKGTGWLRLTVSSGTAAALVLAADLVLSGNDGRIAAYATMLLAAALALAWALRSRRRP